MRSVINLMPLLLIVFIVIFSSCKKNEEDPFISLRSRDARITGEWKLTKFNSSSSETYSYAGGTYTQTTIKTFDGELMTETTDGDTEIYSYSYNITINKDGTYSSTEIEKDEIYFNEGNWYWINDVKEKTGISFDEDIYEILGLKNKELILKQQSHYKYTEADGSYDEWIFEATWTFEKQ